MAETVEEMVTRLLASFPEFTEEYIRTAINERLAQEGASLLRVAELRNTIDTSVATMNDE